MVSLFPIRAILAAVAIATAAMFIFLKESGAFNGSTLHDLWVLARYVLGLPAIILGSLWIIWRVSKRAQRATFPFVGGHWKGHLRYGPADEQELRDADLTISQNLEQIDLVLETRESYAYDEGRLIDARARARRAL